MGVITCFFYYFSKEDYEVIDKNFVQWYIKLFLICYKLILKILYSYFSMIRKVVNKKFTLLLILGIFCFSSATLSGFLLYASEVHFEHHNAHTHHHDDDHDLGESDHDDADTILYLDYIVTNSSGFSKAYFTPNIFLQYSIPDICCNNFFNITSKFTLLSSINKFLTAEVYQLNSSFLI